MNISKVASRAGFLLVMVLITGGGCGKEEKDCPYNNNGVVTSNFTDLTVRHRVMVGKGTDLRSEDIAVGVASQVFVVAPGNYSHYIAVLDSAGTMEHISSRAVEMTECSKVIVNYAF